VNWQIIFAVGSGGFLGAVGRFLISGWIHRLLGPSFPYGTLAVNTLGSFIIGFLILYFEQTLLPHQKIFVVTGLLGALTTFSTFSLETVWMLEENLYLKAATNISLNIILSITATVIGMALFRKLYGI